MAGGLGGSLDLGMTEGRRIWNVRKFEGRLEHLGFPKSEVSS